MWKGMSVIKTPSAYCSDTAVTYHNGRWHQVEHINLATEVRKESYGKRAHWKNHLAIPKSKIGLLEEAHVMRFPLVPAAPPGSDNFCQWSQACNAKATATAFKTTPTPPWGVRGYGKSFSPKCSFWSYRLRRRGEREWKPNQQTVGSASSKILPRASLTWNVISFLLKDCFLQFMSKVDRISLQTQNPERGALKAAAAAKSSLQWIEHEKLQDSIYARWHWLSVRSGHKNKIHAVLINEAQGVCI